MKKIKLLFILENLSSGGAEKVLVNLVNNMNFEQFDITVLTLFCDGQNADSLKKDIEYVSLKRKKFKGIRLFTKFFPKRLLYKHYIKTDKYDIVVAFMTGVPAFVASGAKSKKIAWLHGEFFKEKKIYNFGLKSVYKKFNAVVGVSDYVCKSFKKAIGSAINPITVYNTNDVAKIKELSIEDCPVAFKNNSPVICSVGRLVKEKAYDRLINVAARLKKEGFDFNLVIVGDGEKRDELRKQVKNLNACKYIRFTGYDANPYKYLRQSDIFVCSSYTEGLSTALTEAVILGLPCVSTNVSGAKEILGENNEYGIVTENSEQGIYVGLRKMLEDENIRRHYSQKATERSVLFNTENTVKQAEDLFKSLINNGAAFRVE